MVCPIVAANWNNGANAGPGARNFNNVRGNSNNNVSFVCDSKPMVVALFGECRLAKRDGLSRLEAKWDCSPLFSNRPAGDHQRDWSSAMKRIGNLFDQISSTESLMAAWRAASEDKHSDKNYYRFTRRLGRNIYRLQQTLRNGTYRPAPCIRFKTKERGKERLIEAPTFNDLVVQHAVYAVILPICDRRFIHHSFACRIGKGTHMAADWLQDVMQQADTGAWLLHVDVRKFFYSIDRAVLFKILGRWIKDKVLLRLMAMFCMASGAERRSNRQPAIANLCQRRIKQPGSLLQAGAKDQALRPIHGRFHHDRFQPGRGRDRAIGYRRAPGKSRIGDQSLPAATHKAGRELCRVSHLAQRPVCPQARTQRLSEGCQKRPSGIGYIKAWPRTQNTLFQPNDELHQGA